MLNKKVSKSFYNDQPCDRCGSRKIVSKTWEEKLQTSLGDTIIEVSQTICSNKECQEQFNKDRSEEVDRINARKAAKEEQDKIRKDNIAKAIVERNEAKMAVAKAKN